MSDDAAVLLLYTGQESRNVHKCDDWNIEAVAEADLLGNLIGHVNVEAACQYSGLVGDNSHHLAGNAGKAYYTVGSIVLMHFKKRTGVYHRVDYVPYIVTLVRVVGDNGQKGFLVKSGINGRVGGRFFQIVQRQVAYQRFNLGYAVVFIGSHEVGHAR